MKPTLVRLTHVECVGHAISRIPPGYDIWDYGDNEDEKEGMKLSYYYRLHLARHTETPEEAMARLLLQVKLLQKARRAGRYSSGVAVSKVYIWKLHQRYLLPIIDMFEWPSNDVEGLLRETANAYKREQRELYRTAHFEPYTCNRCGATCSGPRIWTTVLAKSPVCKTCHDIDRLNVAATLYHKRASDAQEEATALASALNNNKKGEGTC